MASGAAIARPLGCTDDTIYAMRDGRIQPRLADVLAMPTNAARRILTVSLHLVDWRTLPQVDFDSALLHINTRVAQLLATSGAKPVEDCTREELEERLRGLRSIHDETGSAIRDLERAIQQKDVLASQPESEKGGR